MLDVACGPGTVARMTTELVGPLGHVTAGDISEEMDAVQHSMPGKKSAPPVEFDATDSPKLPFDDSEFDLVICQRGLQFFEDTHAALVEMHPVLKPTGRLAVAGRKSNSARISIRCIMRSKKPFRRKLRR